MFSLDNDLRSALRSARSGIPLLSPFLFLVVGMTAAHSDTGLSLLLLSVALVAELTWSRMTPRYSLMLRSVFLSVVMLIGSADVALRRETFNAAQQLSDKTARYVGVAESVSETSSGRQVVARLGREAVSGDSARCFRAILFLQFDVCDICAGDSFALRCRMQPVEPLLDVDEEIDVDNWLMARGIVAKSVLSNPADCSTISQNDLSRFFACFVDREREIIDRSQLSAESKSLLKAFLTADGAAIQPDEHQRFAIAGVAHLLAISGAHVMIVAAIFNLLLMPLLVLGMGNTTRKCIVVAIVWFFAATCALQASVLRASVMFTVVICADILQTRNSNSNSVILAAILLLLFKPDQLYDVGFLLSFGAVAGILAFMPERHATPKGTEMLALVKDSVIMSVAAMSVSGAISAYYFHVFPIYFLLSNILAALVMPWLLAAGVFLLAGGWLGIGTTMPAAIVNFFVWVLTHAVDLIASLPWAIVEYIYFDAWLFIPYLVMLSLVWCALHSRRLRRHYLYAAIAMIGVVLIPSYSMHAETSPEWIVSRSASSAEIIVNDGNSLWVAGATDGDALDRIARRYEIYMRRRGLSGPVDLDAATSVVRFDAMGYPMAARRKLKVVGFDTILLVDHHGKQSDLPDMRTKYVIFGRNTATKNDALRGLINADTILTFHADKWDGSGMAVHDLRVQRWRRQIPSSKAPVR